MLDGKLNRQIAGCLLGTAVADALGLPLEGLSARRGQRMFPDLEAYHLLLGRGWCSDDTEHACLTAQALIVAGTDDQAFARDLAWRLRWWLLGLPAGIGMATLKGIVRLWLGYAPDRAGVSSAGNGPAMRAALLGLCHGAEPLRLRRFVRAATRLTHTDPRAEMGAYAVALAAYWAAGDGEVLGEAYLDRLRADLGTDGAELTNLLERAAASAAAGETTATFAAAIGCARGVSGFVLHTVPVAIHAWLRHPEDYRAAVVGAIRCGGDTDTVAAIVGALVGLRVGRAGIPPPWIAGLAEWPRDVAWMEALAAGLASSVAAGVGAEPPRIDLPGLLLRNLCFVPVVLGHGFRRMLPPY